MNGGYAKNEVEFFDEPSTVLPWQSITGRPHNTPLMYNAIGVFRDQADVDAYPHWPGARPGDIRFEDVNSDGQIIPTTGFAWKITPYQGSREASQWTSSIKPLISPAIPGCFRSKIIYQDSIG